MNGWKESNGTARGHAAGIELTVTVQRWDQVSRDVRTLPSPNEGNNPKTLLLSDHAELPEEAERPGFRIEGHRNGRRTLSAFLVAPEAVADRHVNIRLFTRNISPDQFLVTYIQRRDGLSKQLQEQLTAFVKLMGPGPDEVPDWDLSEDEKTAAAMLNRLRLTVMRRAPDAAAAGVEQMKNNSMDIRNNIEAGSPNRGEQQEDVLSITLTMEGQTVCMAVVDGDEEINGATSAAGERADLRAYTQAHSPREILDWLVELTTTRPPNP